MNQIIEKGYCGCGCGGKTNLATENSVRDQTAKGEPKRFINGHFHRGKFREESVRWEGGKVKHHGYIYLYQPDHPRASKVGYVAEHIVIAEKALGKSLPDGAEVHHVNESKSDNRPSNLVICPNKAYHRLLHQRTRAVAACGQASWRKCWYCKRYDNPLLMAICKQKGKSNAYYHLACQNAYQAKRRIAKRGKVA